MFRELHPVGRRWVVVASVILMSLAAACSGTEDTPDAKAAPSTSTPSSSSTTPTAAFVDVAECESASGSGVAKGTITNNGSGSTAYNITIAFRDSSGAQLATGSTTTEEVAPGEVVEWSVEATGLGSVSSDDLTCTTVSLEPMDGAAPTTAAAAGSTDDEFPCDLLTPGEVAQIVGNPLDGDAMTSPTSEDDLSWTARQCVWSGPPSSTSVELTWSVSRPDDFPSGASMCPPPMGATTPVARIGTSATWSWTDPGTEQKVGVLRVCSPEAFVVVQVSGTPTDPQQLQVATLVAEKVLAALPE